MVIGIDYAFFGYESLRLIDGGEHKGTHCNILGVYNIKISNEKVGLVLVTHRCKDHWKQCK